MSGETPDGAARLIIGQEILDGRLVVRGVLGHGAMGVVYRADDRRLGRQVALKTLASVGPDQIYQLKREHRTLVGVSHPNLVQIYELGVAGGLWFLIMELVDGVDLAAWLRLKPTRSRVLGVFGELAEGLRVLHAAGLMHRDVKPTNVMVTPNEHAVLLDFGLTAPIRDTGATLTAGTLDYMAPEQLWNESPGAPADWYSFGVVLFEALAGVLPFTGPDKLKAMRKGLDARGAPIAPSLSPAIDELIRRLLDPEPSRRPGPDEIATVLEIRSTPGAAAPPAQTPFVGRTDALRRLDRALHDVRSGDAQVAHVHGPSGIGKTALAREFLSQARASGNVLVLEGSCHPRESVPYKAFDALIDNLVRHLLSIDQRSVLALAPRHAAALLHVFPVLGRVPGVREWPVTQSELSPSELRRRGFGALREVLAKLADQQMLVLWIDDVQWSDRDSGVMLQALLAPPDAPRLLLLLTSRDDHGQTPLLSALPPAVTQTEVALDRLTDAESLELARSLAGTTRLETDLAAVAAEARGSPFLLAELVRYLQESSRGGRGTFSVADALKARFDQLTPDARRLLDSVAIAGRPLEIELAIAAAGISAAGRVLAYSLCAGYFLRISTQDERSFLETYHDRLREYAIARMAPEAKRARHRALASAIEASRTPDSRALVQHYLEAGDTSKAAHFALLAAQEAERDLAFDQAVEMYDVVLALTPGARHDRELLERRARMLGAAARRTEAALAYEDAARAAPEHGETRTALRVQAAEQFFYGGELRQGLTVLEAVLADLGVRVPSSSWGRSLGALWRRARFIARGSRLDGRRADSIDRDTRMRLDALWRTTRGMVMLDPALADVLAGMHLLEALRCGDTSRALRAIGLEAAIEANIGGRWFRQRSRRLLAAAERMASEHGDAYDAAWLAQCRAACAFFEGRWRECIELGRTADAKLRKSGVGVSWDLAALNGFMLSALANLGRLLDLSRKAAELVDDAERRRDQYALRVFRTGDAVLIWLAADRVAMALQLADQTLQDYQVENFTSQHRHHLVATVQSHLYAGDPEAAWGRVEQAWPLLRRSGFLLMDCLGTQLRYLKACAALAMARGPARTSPGRFLRVARHEARRISRSALPMASPMAQAIKAGIAGAKRQREAQVVALTAAVEGFDLAEMSLHREAAHWHLASLSAPDTPDPRSSTAWMERQGVVRPDWMARAVVPEA